MIMEFWPVWLLTAVGVALTGWAFWYAEVWKLSLLPPRQEPDIGEPASVYWVIMGTADGTPVKKYWQFTLGPSGPIRRLVEFD